MPGAESYYDILALVRTADADEVKKAFRKLSLKYHPERAVGMPKAEAEVVFSKIAEAYEVLSSPARRAIYDQYRYGWHMWEHLFGLSQYSSTGQWHNCVCALPAPLPPAPVRSLLLRCAPLAVARLHTLCPWCAYRRPR